MTCKSTRCFLPSFKSNCLLVQEKKRKLAFKDGHHGGHLGFLIGTILASFELQVIPILPTRFRVNWPFVLGEEAKNKFSRWPPSWISDRNNFSYFCSTRHPMLPTKFRVNWPFDSGEEKKYSSWLPWRPSWISDQNDFSKYWSTSHPDASYQVSSQ